MRAIVFVLVSLGGLAHAAAPLTATSAESTAKIATRFYDAFASRDMKTMSKIYAPNVRFHDPVFGTLRGNNRVFTPMKMWDATIGKTPAKISFTVLSSDATSAAVHWQADYEIFGRPVHNDAISHLTIKNGEIVKQHDEYSWQKWSGQALPLGPLARSKLVHKALTGLFRLSLLGSH
jgi:ketosteroid isomerase-like protein